MSKRTRTHHVDPTIAALQAAAVDADIIASNLFAVASEAAQRTGDLRRLVDDQKAKVVRLNARCNDTGFACDVDDAVDAERRLARLEQDLVDSTKATLAAIGPWREAQAKANALAFQVLGETMHGSTASASEAR
jgi:hypothetical protein